MEKNYLFIHAVFDPVERGEWASRDASGERIGTRVRVTCFDGLYYPGQVYPVESTMFAPDYGTGTEYRPVWTRADNRETPEYRYRLPNCELSLKSPLTAGDNASQPIGSVRNFRPFYVTHTGPIPSWGSFPQLSYTKPLPGQRQGRDKGDGIAVYRMTLSPAPDVAKRRITADYPLHAGNGKEGLN